MRIKTFSLLLLIFTLSLFAGGPRSAASAPGASVVSISQPGPEGAEGSLLFTNFNFMVQRVNDLSTSCTVSYETRDGAKLSSSPGALAPEDFQHVSGTLTFMPGEQSKVVTVRIVGEMFHEMDENFSLNLTSASGCTIGNGSATAFITNDESIVPPGSCFNGIEGDATFDAAIRVDDLVKIRRAVLGLEPLIIYACPFRQLDINGDCGDGQLDAADVTVLRQWILAGPSQRLACGPLGPPSPI